MASSTPTPNTAAQDLSRTSFLLSNLHCPSCVSAINHVLRDSFPDHVQWVSPNIVTSVVTVEHKPAATVKNMFAVLEEAGFDVCGVSSSADDPENLAETSGVPPPTSATGTGAGETTGHGISRPTFALKRWMTSSRLGAKATPDPEEQDRAHLDNCQQCREARPQNPEARSCHGPTATAASGSHSPTSSQLTPSSSASVLKQKPRTAPKSGTMSTDSVLTGNTSDTQSVGQETWQAKLAVGGMTCASCSNAITAELNKIEWITRIAVNSVSGSATVEFHGKENAPKIAEAIEDIGYDAALDEVVNLEQEKPDTKERTVEIKLDGVYCGHCPGRVVSSIEGFRRHLQVVGRPTSARPIIKINYTPDAPKFTIRTILEAVEASDSALTASIYHPPTLEERSKMSMRNHQWQLLQRVIFTTITAIPTFILGIVYMSLVQEGDKNKEFLMEPWTSGISRAQIAMFVMATPVYLYAANVFHARAFKEIRTLWRRGSRTPYLQRFYRFGSMNMLMSLGTSIAYISSVAQLIAAGVNPPERVDDNNFYFDSVVFLTLFLLIGRWIESYSKSKLGDAVGALGKLRPSEAILVESDGKDTIVNADLLEFGDTIRVRHGSSPPADGTVVEGESSFDESSLTGESRLIKKKPGDEVFAGTVNKDKPILIKITGVAGSSMLDQIVSIVREGQGKRAPVEHYADLITSYFVPIITLIAILTWLIWLILGVSGVIPREYLGATTGGWVAFGLQFAIAVFVVACPCGLGLAAPTAVFVGGGLAAKHGILAKGGGEAFEKASKIDCVVFDKTGTLTVGGEPTIADSELFPDDHSVDGKEKWDMLQALQTIEESSSHPIAKAIVSWCSIQKHEHKVTVDDLREIPGKGMKATYHTTSPEQSFEMLVGNEALMKDFSVTISPQVSAKLDQWKGEAKSIALAATKPLDPSSPGAKPWSLAAVLSISDHIRPEAAAVIHALQQRGTAVWMLSGDNATTAQAVAKLVGIPSDQVISGVLPSQKADKIAYLQSPHRAHRGQSASNTRRSIVAMIGDGINDSPALTTADVGIAIGSGSDVAISSAAFVLVSSDLRSVVTLLNLSKTVFRRIQVNFFWAGVYNIIAVPIAAGVLYPIVSRGSHIRLDPVWASLAMALSSISVVMSSLALKARVPLLGFRERRIEVD